MVQTAFRDRVLAKEVMWQVVVLIPKGKKDYQGMTEWVTLYSRVPPPGDSIPVDIEPFAVEDGVPEESEVECAVKHLQNNRAGGPSRMREEDLKG